MERRELLTGPAASVWAFDDDEGSPLFVSISLDEESLDTVSVDFKIEGITAEEGVDFEYLPNSLLSGTITFGPGATYDGFYIVALERCPLEMLSLRRPKVSL
jgi:hypothetical protein